jgi:hypothetical protein
VTDAGADSAGVRVQSIHGFLAPSRLLIANECHLRQMLTEYLRHCNTARHTGH